MWLIASHWKHFYPSPQPHKKRMFISRTLPALIKNNLLISLVMQQLKLHVSTVEGTGLIPDPETKIPHASGPKSK